MPLETDNFSAIHDERVPLCAAPVLSQPLTFCKNLCLHCSCKVGKKVGALSEPPPQASQVDGKGETSLMRSSSINEAGSQIQCLFFPQYLFNILFLGSQRGPLFPHLPTPWPLTSQHPCPQVRTKAIQMARRKKETQAPRKTGIAGTSSKKEISRSTWEFV